MAGIETDHPMPNAPLPAPESYCNDSCGLNPDRAELTAMGMLSEPVPVTALAENFSPMPRMAPPPLGRLIWGALKGDAAEVVLPALPVSTSSAIVTHPIC